MDDAGVELIVNAVAGKSLWNKEGCNPQIFEKVRARVHIEVQDLVLKGVSQLDAILTQKKRLQAIFASELLAYQMSNSKQDVVVIDDETETTKDTEQNGDVGAEVEEVKFEEKRSEERLFEEKKREERKSEERSREERKSEERKSEERKSEDRKSEDRKSEDRKSEERKSEEKRREERKAEEKKREERKAEEKRREEKRREERKAEEKRRDEKKAEEKKKQERIADYGRRVAEQLRKEEIRWEWRRKEEIRLKEIMVEDKKLAERKLEEQKLEEKRLELERILQKAKEVEEKKLEENKSAERKLAEKLAEKKAEKKLEEKKLEEKQLEEKKLEEKKLAEKKLAEQFQVKLKELEEKKCTEKKIEIKLLSPEERNPEEKEPEKPSAQTKQYFDYLAEYKNDADVYERVKGLEIRGNHFPVSNDGSCPRCHYKSNVFVALDFLFPAGDMPEILHYLLTLGKAVLWSSKENMNCKDPPIFLCQGKCPADINKCGFNINWRNTDLDKIFLFPHENYKPLSKLDDGKYDDLKADPSKVVKATPNDNLEGLRAYGGESDASLENDMMSEESEDEYDEGEVDIEYYKKKISWVVLDEVSTKKSEEAELTKEEAIIRNMLALEEARIDFINGQMKKKEDEKSKKEEKDAKRLEKIQRESFAKIQHEPPKNDPPPPPPPKEKTIVSVNGRRVTVDEILNDINNKLQSKDGRQTSYRANTAYYPPPHHVHRINNATNAAGAAHAIASNVSNTLNTPKPPEKPTPTHILKGATYYDENKAKEVDAASKPAFTVHDFPVSKDGVCPYCHSSDVVYIILLEDDEKDELPILLERLFNEGKAVKRKRGEYDLPSFQCKACTYGFNLDWNSTNLEKIFPNNPVPVSSAYPAYSTNDMNTSMNYAGYNAMNNPYMYNTYAQSYAQAAVAPAYGMNTYGYMAPVAMATTHYQTAASYQGMAGAYSNYMQSQYAQSAAMNYSTAFNQYKFPPPPPVGSSSSYDYSESQTYSDVYTTSSSAATSEITHTTRGVSQSVNSVHAPSTTADSDSVDMDVDNEEGDAISTIESAKCSPVASAVVSDGKKSDAGNDSSSELYDPFAELGEDQVSTEEDSAKRPVQTENELKEEKGGSASVALEDHERTQNSSASESVKAKNTEDNENIGNSNLQNDASFTDVENVPENVPETSKRSRRSTTRVTRKVPARKSARTKTTSPNKSSPRNTEEEKCSTPTSPDTPITNASLSDSIIDSIGAKSDTSDAKDDTSNDKSDKSNPKDNTSNSRSNKGDASKAKGDTSNAKSDTSNAKGDTSNAKGDTSNANGDTSNAKGDTSNAKGDTSTAKGDTSNANGDTSNAKGNKSNAKGDTSNAKGDTLNAKGNKSNAKGDTLNAKGNKSNAKGDTSNAKGDTSNAKGDTSNAKGNKSNAKGNKSNAKGNKSNAKGDTSKVKNDIQNLSVTKSHSDLSDSNTNSTISKADASKLTSDAAVYSTEDENVTDNITVAEGLNSSLKPDASDDDESDSELLADIAKKSGSKRKAAARGSKRGGRARGRGRGKKRKQ